MSNCECGKSIQCRCARWVSKTDIRCQCGQWFRQQGDSQVANPPRTDRLVILKDCTGREVVGWFDAASAWFFCLSKSGSVPIGGIVEWREIAAATESHQPGSNPKKRKNKNLRSNNRNVAICKKN